MAGNRKLVKLLQYAFAGNTERSRMLNSEDFKKTVLDTIPKETRELMKSEGLESTTLLQEEVYKTIVEGGQPFRCMREVLPVIKTDSYSVRIVYGESGSYADEIAEGAKIPVNTQSLSKRDITIKKYGTRPLITNELIEDGLFDIVELELRWAGARLENTLNREVLKELLKDMNGISDVDPAGTHIAVTDIAKARAAVRAKGYMPTVLVTSPTAEGYLLADSNLAYVSYAGTNVPLTEGKIPTILGLKPYTCGVTTGYTTASATTPKWDVADEAYDYYAMVLDPSHAGIIAMRRDYTVEQYDDPIHDLVGISATMRFGVEVIQTDAGVRILYK